MDKYTSMADYQEGIKGTFKQHSTLDSYNVRLLNWTVGLAGETGEVAELVKHHIFSEKPLDIMQMAKELGDVLWYLTAMATTLGIKLEDIMALNIAKIEHRYNGGGYTDDACNKRHASEEEFKDTEIYKQLVLRIAAEGVKCHGGK